MIRSPLALRLSSVPDRSIKDQIRDAARVGAKGMVLDAIGDLSPDRLAETGRRELRHLLRSVGLDLVAVGLPTRRAFDTQEQFDERLARADRAFALAYELGARLSLARVGAVPPETDTQRRENLRHALNELGRRAERRGLRLAIEAGSESGSVLRAELEIANNPGLAASVDPLSLMRSGHDPVRATRELGPWVAHAYARDTPSPGALDWAAYLGALEEVEYRGFLTIWPDPAEDAASRYTAIAAILNRF
jgi:sugar phosphate isomerase/epimerase